jgi:hypothetical protein
MKFYFIFISKFTLVRKSCKEYAVGCPNVKPRLLCRGGSGLMNSPSSFHHPERFQATYMEFGKLRNWANVDHAKMDVSLQREYDYMKTDILVVRLTNLL